MPMRLRQRALNGALAIMHLQLSIVRTYSSRSGVELRPAVAAPSLAGITSIRYRLASAGGGLTKTQVAFGPQVVFTSHSR